MKNKEAIEYITRLRDSHGNKMAYAKDKEEMKLHQKFYEALELALNGLKRNAREEELWEQEDGKEDR